MLREGAYNLSMHYCSNELDGWDGKPFRNIFKGTPKVLLLLRLLRLNEVAPIRTISKPLKPKTMSNPSTI